MALIPLAFRMPTTGPCGPLADDAMLLTLEKEPTLHEGWGRRTFLKVQDVAEGGTVLVM